MSTPTIYIPNSLVPSHDFQVTKGSDGVWSGSMSFTCDGDFWNTSTFRIGVPITDYYDLLGASWEFLRITDVSVERMPGALCRVVTQFSGMSETTGKEPGEDEEKSGTFTMNATLVDAPLTAHWRFDEIEDPEFSISEIKTAISEIIKDRSRLVETTYNGESYYSVMTTDGRQDTIFSFVPRAGSEVEWQDDFSWPNFFYLLQRGIKTFLAPSVEWTQTFVNRGSLPDSVYAQLDYIDPNPAGPPPTFPKRNWRLVSIEQNWEIFTGDGEQDSTSYTKTWALSPPGEEWNAELYTKP